MKTLMEAIGSARFPHPHYELAIRASVSRITFALPGSVIALIGPTRVGKSSAIRVAAQQVYPGGESSEIPYIVVDCSRTDSGFISTRYLTLDMLIAVEHPFYQGDNHLLRLSLTETNARHQLRRAIAYRGTRLIVLDEAHHLLRVKNRSGKEAALESLKCLGNETGAVIFLVGGYELLKACFCSSHMNGRLSIIEFPRYKPEEADLHHFCKILASYDKLLPWAKNQSLISIKEFIYEGSLGSCGLITSWVLLALANMATNGDSKLRREHFRNTRFEQQMEEIQSEITFGESVLSPLRLSASSRLERAPESPEITREKSTRRGNRRPGRRLPMRDKAGRLQVVE